MSDDYQGHWTRKLRREGSNADLPELRHWAGHDLWRAIDSGIGVLQSLHGNQSQRAALLPGGAYNAPGQRIEIGKDVMVLGTLVGVCSGCEVWLLQRPVTQSNGGRR